MPVRLFILLILIPLAAQPAAPQTAPATNPSAPVDDLVRRATAPSADSAQRDALLAQAIQLMHRQLQDTLTHATTQPADVLAQAKLELKLAETELLRAGPHATHLLHLQGTERDRRKLAELSESALKRLRGLSREIDGKLVVWRGDYKLLVTAVPAMEDLQSAVAYRTAWAALYRALALPPGDERDSLLAESAALAQPFTRPQPAAPDGGDLRHIACLLIGTASRERAQFPQAANALVAAADSADPDLRAEARFQVARNLIEHGLRLSRAGDPQAASREWRVAADFIAAYVVAAIQARGPADPTADDLNAALLTHALHQAQSAAADTPDAQRDQDQQAQAALAKFAASHTQAASQLDFLAVVADKYRTVSDRATLNALVLLAIAVGGLEPGSAPTPQQAAEACELLNAALARRDPSSATVRPAALWYLATTEAARAQPRRAAQLFAQLAREFPNSPFARPAALNAVVCYNNLLSASDPPADDPAIQADFLAALEALLARWGTDPDVAGWHFDLGWRYEKLADSAPPDAAEPLRDKALAAYRAVPPPDPRHLQAVRRALDIQLRRLPDRPVAAQAAELVSALRACATEAKAANTPDALDTGAWADLAAARILADVLDRRADALALLNELPSRWPGSRLVADALAFHAQTLLADGQVDQAVSAVQALGKARPAHARSLGRRLLDDMTRRFATSAPTTGPAADPSSPWVAGRVRLAEYLCRSAESDSSDDLSALRQAYAESLLDARRPAEAMDLLLKCRDQADAQSATRRRQIDADLAAKLAAVTAARRDLAKLRALAAQLLADLTAAGLNPTDSRGGWAVRGALAALDGAAPPEEHDRLLDQLASALEDGHRQLAQLAAQAFPAPGDVLSDLARAYADLGRHEDAAQVYAKLTEGLDPRQDPAAYWAAELGYCRSILACRAADPRAMRSLVVRIAQLKVQDPALGGLADQFAAIESQAAQPAP